MDEEPREADAGVDPDRRTPEQIQAEIEATRLQLGATAAAVAEKADVKRQARQQLDEARRALHATRAQVVGRARASAPESAAEGMQQVTATARANPLPLAVGGALLLGFLLGRRGASR